MKIAAFAALFALILYAENGLLFQSFYVGATNDTEDDQVDLFEDFDEKEQPAEGMCGLLGHRKYYRKIIFLHYTTLLCNYLFLNALFLLAFRKRRFVSYIGSLGFIMTNIQAIIFMQCTVPGDVTLF